MRKILFVCLGNICRSPIAEGVARSVIAREGLPYEVDSAGTSDWHKGEHPCANSILVASRHGIDISSQRSRPVIAADRERFDIIIALDRSNRSDLQNMGFAEVYLLGEFGGYGGRDVPDPYHYPDGEGFEKVYEMIEKATEDLLKQFAK